MSTVYVLNKDGKPLMPTTRGGHVRHLLKEQKARVVRAKPFTIQLLYETNDVVQPLYLGIDPGRTNIGVAVVKANGTAVFTAHLETRNKEIPKLMQDRKKARRARRTNGRRCRRQRRAKANGTISKKCVKQTTAQNGSVSKRAKDIGVIKRRLPGCEKDVLCIGIKNKETKFTNRTRPEGWLTPTANQLLQTHINLVKKIQKFLPISDVVLEVNKFAFMRLDNPNIQKWQYQQGPLYKKESLESAVSEIQEHHCLFCKKPIDHYHHVVPQHKNGSNTIEVLPFEGYRSKWSLEQQRHAEKIDKQVDKIVYIAKEPSRGVYLLRDRHLVDCSAYCISYCTRNTGGTAYTVKYALEHGVTVYNASSFDVSALLQARPLGKYG